jgi:D-alanine-D-alanine ligase-like ATP-grasp enzyme
MVGESERKVIEATSKVYHERGLFFIGYDFLQDDGGEWIVSEINPGGNIGGFTAPGARHRQALFPRLLDWLLELAAR